VYAGRPGIGGLLNATLGNALELILSLAVRKLVVSVTEILLGDRGDDKLQIVLVGLIEGIKLITVDVENELCVAVSAILLAVSFSLCPDPGR
jgi:hypothetical protein